MKRLTKYIFTFLFLVSGASFADSLSADIQLNHPIIVANEKSIIYAVIKLDAITVKEDEMMKRPQLNLSLVLDRSGSMSDKGKMEYSIEASKSLIDFLDTSDILSIVEYDDQISVLWPASPMESPNIAKRRIEELYPRGSTNLTGGMLKGVKEVNKNKNSDKLNRVILLSDGLANMGITNPIQIKELVQEAKSSGVRISTMGLGLDYNEDLMLSIAEHGGGNYYFIENPRQMQRIFEQEINTLFTTVAKDIKVTLDFPNSIKSIETFGYVSSIKNNQLSVDIENLYSGESRTILLRMELDPQSDEEFTLGKLNINYFDIEKNNKSEIKNNITAKTTINIEDYKKAINQKVEAEAILIEADKKHEEYIKMYEKGDKENAIKNIKNLEKELNNRNASIGNIEVSKKIEALKMESEEIEAAEESSDQKQIYLKKSKQRFYGGKKGQRSKYIQQEGMQGYDVELLQEALRKFGFYKGEINGIFNDDVKNAVIDFQTSNGLTADGIAGPATLKALGIY